MEILKKMKKSKIFDEISENDLKALHFCFKTRVFEVKKGEILIDEGEPFESIVLVLDGHLRSELNDYYGNTSILADYHDGETIGVEEAFTGNNISQYTLIAIEDTQVLTMNKYSVMKPCDNMCPRHTQFQNNLVKIISQKNIELMQKFNHITKSSTKEKVLSYLQYISKQQNSKNNLNQSLIIMVPNSTDYGGICQMWADGSAIAFCPMSTYGYPFDTRGVIQHEAGGHGFGKLGDEYIYHNAFIDFCDCTCCGHVMELESYFSLGWFQNLSLTGKMHEVPWSHLIFDERYSDIVDIFEGGYMHSRGVFRSEQNSCMNNDIPYYSTISREAIVKRIKAYAGEEYSFEEFVANDSREAGIAASRFAAPKFTGSSMRHYQMHPQIHEGSPLK